MKRNYNPKHQLIVIMLAVIVSASMLIPSINAEAKKTVQKTVICTTCNDKKKCQTCDGTGLSEETIKELERLKKQISDEIENSDITLSQNNHNEILKTSHGQHKDIECNKTDPGCIINNTQNIIQVSIKSSNVSDNTYCKDCNGTGKCSACCVIDKTDNGSAAKNSKNNDNKSNNTGKSTNNNAKTADKNTGNNTTFHCATCNDCGDCPKCGGLKDCDKCSGEGSFDCDRCFNGTCTNCNGSGYVDYYRNNNIVTKKCTRCNNGDCRSCNGTGSKDCTACSNGECSRCKGTGECPSCHGAYKY